MIVFSDVISTSAGLIITQSLTIMIFLQWGIKMSAEVANQMTCIERVVEYTQLEQEEFNQGSNQISIKIKFSKM